jgi:solute carrier family 8 (sodium/calcium exchanger)
MMKRAGVLALIAAVALLAPAHGYIVCEPPTDDEAGVPTVAPTTEASVPRMCEAGGDGAFYSKPAYKKNDKGEDVKASTPKDMGAAWVTYGIVYWNLPFKIIIYFIGLIWSFLAVGIIADVFMAAIEVITSAEKNIKTANGEEVSVKVWNATVANLTLMALGSSAPEILLSVYEILMGSFLSGELGPSTIVGSAAFNLLVIIAVCVMGIPEGETRKIADMGVFKITAVSSVFAYLWLMIILMFVSPDVVELWEALLTFLFFPALVGAAYGADRNWFRESKVTPAQHVIQIGAKHYKPGEAVELLKKIDTNGMSQEETEQILVALAAEGRGKPTRAQLRMQAMRNITGQKRIIPPKPKHVEIKYKDEGASKGPPKPRVFFGDVTGAICTKLAVLESEPCVNLTILREPCESTLSVHYETVDGTAKAGSDFEAQKGDLKFEEGEYFKTISIKIFDDDEVEEDEHFMVKLSEVPGSELDLEGADKSMTALVTIIDDDEPGEVGFLEEHVNITVEESKGIVEVPVTRQNGSAGVIKVKYTTVDGTAIAGRDYTMMSDEIEFQRGEITKLLRIPITQDQRYECDETFDVKLEFVSGPPRAQLCERATCTVRIVSDEKTKELCDKVAALVNLNVDKYKVGTSNWSQQFKDALSVSGGEDDEDEGPPGTTAVVMHYLCLPWKLIYALVPPTDYGGGWVCFFTALIFIGLTTIFIADLASYFGCVMGLKDSVTAITFVALGTSLPDTFASKAAAVGDDTADAAVGNVTGSNSVNVFLGLGLPWLIAALYWEAFSPPAENNVLWDANYGCYDNLVATYPDVAGWRLGKFTLGNDKNFAQYRFTATSDEKRLFAVPSGDLGFSVGVFSTCAIICLLTLVYRRQKYGAELGGEPGPAKFHATCFVGLWFFYVLMSSLSAYGIIKFG